jgi:hypothetical protein
MKNIFLIPSDKLTFGKYLVLNKVNKLCIWNTDTMGMQKSLITQNIYITNDEDIKDGEWALDLCEDLGLKYQPFKVDKATLKYANQECKKIILTTDPTLIKDNVQSIDDEFLEWFCSKNGEVDFVEIEIKEYINYCIPRSFYYKYKIIIPQEELKRKIDTCYNFNKEIGCVQDICRCEQEEPKQKFCDNCNNDVCCCIIRTQETLEEALKRMYPNSDDRNLRIEFRNGAKWQKERMYSEEEVVELVYNIIGEYGKYYGIMIDGAKLNDLFEQFKKK